MNVIFVHPGMLLLVWLAPAMAAWWLMIALRREGRLEEFMSVMMRRKLGPRDTRWRFICQVVLLTLGFMLAIVAAARPQWGLREERVLQRGRDLMIVLDVSRSMLANDVHPSRLERAKADILDLIDELRGDRAGLITFRQKAILLCPLTTDYAFLKQVVDSVDIDSAPAGETDIGDALRKAWEAFGDDDSSYKAVVLISDGEDLSGQALVAAEELAKRNIPVFAVGLGNRDGAKIPESSTPGGYLQFKGEPVVTRLHDDVLHEIARKTGGAYVPVGVASMATTTLGTLYRDHLRRIAAREQEETLERRHIERYQIFLAPGLLMFVVASFLSRGRLSVRSKRVAGMSGELGRSVNRNRLLGAQAKGEPSSSPMGRRDRPLKDLTPPKRPLKNLSAVATALLVAAVVAYAQPTNTTEMSSAVGAGKGQTAGATGSATPAMRGHEAAWKAARLFALGRYEEAARLFLEAGSSLPQRLRQDCRYNAALALYRAGKFMESAQILRGLLQETSEPAWSLCTGLGAALYRDAESKTDKDPTNLVVRAHLLKEAGEAFKLAARTDTGDTAAQHNLALVLKKLPEAEEHARIAQLMARYEQVPTADLVNLMLLNQRRINEESRAAFTNNSPSQILHLEELARQQKENAELWIPLKSKLVAALSGQPDLATNRQYMARLENMVEALRDSMLENAESLRDLDSSAYPAAKQAEQGIYQIWKGVAPFPLVLEEAIRRQTNCIIQSSAALAGKDTDLSAVRTEQEETTGLTRLFVERFRLAVPEEGISLTTNSTREQSVRSGSSEQTSTNRTDRGPGQNDVGKGTTENSESAPGGISAETRQQILSLAERAIAAQQSAIGHLGAGNVAESLVQQKISHDLLCEIRKLLPKEQTPGETETEKKDQSGEESESHEEAAPEPSQPQEQIPAPDQKPSENAKEKREKRELSEEEIQNLLQKALEREKAHEIEKRIRNRRIPMLPRERDW